MNGKPSPAGRRAKSPAMPALFHQVARYRSAVELGWFDFVTMFRRSFFGPLWTLFQIAAWTATITLMFGDRLGIGIDAYVVYVGTGIYAWDIISSALSEGPRHLSKHADLIKSTRIDLSMLSVRKLSFLIFRSLFQAPVAIIIIILFGGGVDIGVLLLIPAILLYAVNLYAILVVFGFIGVYFRDFDFFMPMLVRFLFFTTPIFWAGDKGVRKFFSTYNPFTYFLELIRAPLQGDYASLNAWLVVGAAAIIGSAAAFLVQLRFRRVVIYWI